MEGLQRGTDPRERHSRRLGPGEMRWTFPGPAELFIYNSHRLAETLPTQTLGGFSSGLGELLSKRVFEGGPGYLIGAKL